MPIKVVRLISSGCPVQNEVGCRHKFHLHNVRIERIFARSERLCPHAFVSARDDITVFKIIATHVFSVGTNVRVDDTDVTNRNLNHINLFYLNEPRIESVHSRKDNLLLQTPPSTVFQKHIGILKIVVTHNVHARNLAWVQRFTVHCGNDSDFIFLNLSHFGNRNFKQKRVNSVRSRRD